MCLESTLTCAGPLMLDLIKVLLLKSEKLKVKECGQSTAAGLSLQMAVDPRYRGTPGNLDSNFSIWRSAQGGVR